MSKDELALHLIDKLGYSEEETRGMKVKDMRAIVKADQGD